jgi:DNA-binding transcriptional LysR family regulator
MARREASLDLRRLDLNLLLVLDALFEEGSITRVGQRLQMSQPTVSSALSKLRTLLGDELFLRSNGVMRPTDRALQLRAPVAAVLQSIRVDILGHAGFDPATDQGVFTVSLSDVGEREFMPALTARLAERAPGASLRSVMLDPKRLADAMEAGEVDLAIGYLPDLNAAVFKQQVLFHHGYVCVVRKDHPTLSNGITLEQYFEARHLTVAQDTRFHDLSELALAQLSHRRRHVAVTLSLYVNVNYIVSRSDLVATLPRPIGMHDAALYGLSVFEPPFDIPPVEVKQVWHRRFDASPRVVWLRNLVAEMSQNKPSL